MSTIKALFVIAAIMLIGLPVNLIAQNQYDLNDMLNHRSFHYIQQQRGLKLKNWNLFNDVEIEYPQITGMPDTVMQRKLNNRFSELITGPLQNDALTIALLLKIKQQLNTYLTISDYERSMLGFSKDNLFQFNPTLKSVKFAFLSCINSVATFTIIYRYNAQYEATYLQRDLYYYKTCYVNLATGHEYAPADVFKSSSINYIDNLINNSAEKNLQTLHVKLNQRVPLYTDKKDTVSTGARKLLRFSAGNEGFCIPKPFSIAYYIPGFSPCTITADGNDVEVKLSLDEVRKALNPKGPFASLINYKAELTTLAHGLNDPMLNTENYYHTPQLAGYDFFWFTDTTKVKSITIKHLVKTKDAQGVIQDKEVIQKQANYTNNGYLKSINNFNQDGVLYNTKLYDYDKDNNLVKYTRIKDGQIETAVDYYYDAKKNITEETSIDETSGLPRTVLYYYNNNVMWEEDYGLHDFSGLLENTYRQRFTNTNGLVTTVKITKLSENPSESITESKYDKNGHLLLTYNPRQLPSTGQSYVYDNNGNLIRFEYDNSRYTYEFKYDDQNNLIQETHRDNNTVTFNKTAIYNQRNAVIKVEITDKNRGQKPGVYLITREY